MLNLTLEYKTGLFFTSCQILFCYTVLDSWGRPAPGIFQLNMKWLGDFDECQAVQSTASNPNTTLPDHLDFQGLYCSVGASAQPGAATNPMAMGKLTRYISSLKITI